MELPRGLMVALLAGLALAATVCGQDQECVCSKNRRTVCAVEEGLCKCRSYGSNIPVNCETLTSKCLVMKAEVTGTVSGRRFKPETAYIDNDGIYNPECDDNGKFKAKQCNGTDTCWCVNSAGVRRTEKKDTTLNCTEVVRTSWIIIEIKHLERDTTLDEESIRRAVTDEVFNRYRLNSKHIGVTYEPPFIIVELKQNASEKAFGDVDIADVAYYLEKDIKGDSLIAGQALNVRVSGEPLPLDSVVIYFVDEKPPEFTMKRLTAGVIAVIVVVVLAIVAGILVLIFTRRKRGRYEKAEVKEMNEMHRELKS